MNITDKKLSNTMGNMGMLNIEIIVKELREIYKRNGG